jgi:hypothetical protein
VAKKQQKDARGGTLGEIAEGLGTLLGSAEKQWKAWQGPRDSIVSAVTDVRDRAAALLVEMGVPEAVTRAKEAKDKASGKGDKKKDKEAKKAGKKAKKAEKAAQADAVKADKKKPGNDAKAGKGKKGKKKGKAEKAAAAEADGKESHG